LQQSIQVTSLRPNLQNHSLPRHKAILTAIENKDPLSARHASLVQLEDTKMAYDLIKK
jgi:DNA-binding FadR family transcriptional regulator